MLGAGYDLKRGRGGIREAEFYAQIHQLIHGGRDPSLRAPATRDALAALAGAGWIGTDEAALLIDGYTLLRTIEHRVQMIDDRQTHRLPGGDALDGVARLHGLADGGALLALLAPRVAAVGAIYDALDEDAPVTLAHDPVVLDEALSLAGFADAPAARAPRPGQRQRAPAPEPRPAPLAGAATPPAAARRPAASFAARSPAAAPPA